MSHMIDQQRQGMVMSGSVETGFGRTETTIGTKATGTDPVRGILGLAVIGKHTVMATGGIVDIGNNNKQQHLSSRRGTEDNG
jgi:hypothetical protein